MLTPGFHQHLEQYYARASPEDQARCIELLTALDIAKTLGQQASTSQLPVGAPPQTQRPKTAMAALCNCKSQLKFPRAIVMVMMIMMNIMMTMIQLIIKINIDIFFYKQNNMRLMW